MPSPAGSMVSRTSSGPNDGGAEFDLGTPVMPSNDAMAGGSRRLALFFAAGE